MRDASSIVVTSQRRPRWELQDEEGEEPTLPRRPREPGFLEEDPEEGIPTPRPKMPMTAVAHRLASDAELMSMPLDHRDGFVLSHIDGTTDIRTLIDVCGMTHDELVAVVQRLVALRAIRLV